MDTLLIRQKLHNYMELAEDKKVKAIYTMMAEEIEQTEVEYNDKLKKELDKRQHSYKTGKSKLITSSASKKRIDRILKS